MKPLKPLPPPLPPQPVERQPITVELYVLFFAPFLIFGGLVLLIGLLNMREYLSSMGWQETTGTVATADIASEYRSGRGSCNCYVYWVDMQYTFSAGQRTIITNRVDFDDQVCLWAWCLGSEEPRIGFSRQMAKTRNALDDYPIGRSLQVYYDPDRPENAVLERKLPPMGVGLLIGGLVAVGGSLFAIWWKWQDDVRSGRAEALKAKWRRYW